MNQSAGRGRPSKKPVQMISIHRLPGQFLSLRFQLALHDAQLGENCIPFGFEPAHFVVRQQRGVSIRGLREPTEMIGFAFEPVSDEVMQLHPIIQLQGEETKLGFEPFISHDYDYKLTSSSVSSSFCRLSINKCAQGRSTVCTWLMIPSSK